MNSTFSSTRVVGAVSAAKKQGMLALLALAITLAFAAPSMAQEAAFVLRNPSNVTINYQVKWGADASWTSYSLAPNSRRTHYLAAAVAPTPYIRFDGVGNGWLEYRIDYFVVGNPWNGVPYGFGYSRCGCYLNLYRN